MKMMCLSFMLLAALQNCAGGSPSEMPDCVREKIEALKAEPPRNPPAFVASYEYKGERVFYVPSAAGDRMSELYNKDCELICRPDGGITGRGDGKCTDFFEQRKNEVILWRDER